jgi:hypothetical protein
VLVLARWKYVSRRENIIAVGNSQASNRHIGLGPGSQPAREDYPVGFNTAAALVRELLEAGLFCEQR